jgi:hypothetical protein
MGKKLVPVTALINNSLLVDESGTGGLLPGESPGIL